MSELLDALAEAEANPLKYGYKAALDVLLEDTLPPVEVAALRAALENRKIGPATIERALQKAGHQITAGQVAHWRQRKGVPQ